MMSPTQTTAKKIKQAGKAPNYYPSSRRFYVHGQQSNDSMGPPVGMMSPTHNSNSMDGFNTMTFRAVTAGTPQPGGLQQPVQQQQQPMQQQQQQIMVTSNQAASYGGAPMASAPQPMGVALDPLFVAPPPKTHKALHSDIYLRYIENLAAKRPTLTDFHSTLTPRKNQQSINPNRNLPTHWFKDGLPPAHQANVVEALW